MTNPLTDETLLNAAAAGNRHAMEQLLTASRPVVHRMALSHCASAADADDAAQITLWQIYRRFGGLRALLAYPAWLSSVVRRECWRLSRKVAGWRELPDDTLEVALLADLDLHYDLTAAIQKLAPKYRQVLMLRAVERYSTEEVAQMTKLSPQAVKSRLHRARQMVQKSLRV